MRIKLRKKKASVEMEWKDTVGYLKTVIGWCMIKKNKFSYIKWTKRNSALFSAVHWVVNSK